MVPRERLELSLCRQKRILNPPRLPFRHRGTMAAQYREALWAGQSVFVVRIGHFLYYLRPCDTTPHPCA